MNLGCCSFSFIIFMLLYFFVPRYPVVDFSSSYVKPNATATYNVSHSYKVSNYNMYSLELSKFNFQLSNGDFEYPGIVWSNSMPLPDGEKLHVSKNSEYDLIVRYIVSDASDISTARTQCHSASGFSSTVSGTVHMKTSNANFDSVDFGPWDITDYCL